MKYTKQLLSEVVHSATSFADVARALNLSPVGSTLTHLRKRCAALNVDTTHFVGQGHGRGSTFKFKPVEDILTVGDPAKGRIEAKHLRRALLESGVDHCCSVCTNDGTWQGKPLTLQIDHIDGRYWNNVKSNLRFICPNCHTQTETWGSTKKQTSCPDGGMADAYR